MTQRTVLITGGSRGIGAAIAREFAAAGDRIAIHYVSSTQDAQDVADSLDLNKAELMDAPNIYAGRIEQDRSGQWNLLGFVNKDKNGCFVGEICDPIPLTLTDRGTLQVKK